MCKFNVNSHKYLVRNELNFKFLPWLGLRWEKIQICQWDRTHKTDTLLEIQRHEIIVEIATFCKFELYRVLFNQIMKLFVYVYMYLGICSESFSDTLAFSHPELLGDLRQLY